MDRSTNRDAACTAAPAGGRAPRGEWVTERSRFAELRDPWNELARGSLFLTWDWLDCWWQSFGDGAEMRVRVSWNGPELAAGMACLTRGRHLAAMANKESDLYRPLARSDEEDIEPVLQALASGPFSRITIPGLPLNGTATRRLLEALRESGWLVDQTQRESCPIIATSGSFDDYRKRLSANARRQIGKARRRLEGEGRIQLNVVERVEGDGRLGPLLNECFALEAAGWKGHSRSAILSARRTTQFWRALLERFHGLGTLRVSEVRLDGSLIAFCLGILHGNRLYSLKTSYDERYAYFSPGHVLRMEMIERCFDQGIQAQELLGPTLRWKERYATEARETLIVRAYRRAPVSLARYAGRRYLVPALRPGYRRSRVTMDRLRGRRGAAPAQGRP